MKKLLAILIASLLLVGCQSGPQVKDPTVTNNGNNIMEGYDVPQTNQFIETDYATIMDRLEKRSEGVYYLGYTGCPWCQKLVPVLNYVLVEEDQTAYYLDATSQQFKVIQTRFNAFDASLETSLQSGGYVPFTIFIDKDGNVKTHSGTLTSDGGNTALSSDQVNELKDLLRELVKTTK